MSDTTKTANEILKQLGRHTMVMLGSRHIMATETGLQFKIGRNPKRVTHVHVDLEPDDTYTVTFRRVPGMSAMLRGAPVVVVSSIGLVHAGDLHLVIERGTGMLTSLGSMGR